MPNVKTNQPTRMFCSECVGLETAPTRAVQIEEHDVLGLQSIWSRSIEDAYCTVCGVHFSGQPPIEVHCSFLGRFLRITGRRGEISLTPIEWESTSNVADVFTDLDAFRRALRGVFERTAEPLRTLGRTSTSPIALPEEWRALTAVAFAAESVIRILDGEADLPPELSKTLEHVPRLNVLGEIQGLVWAKLAEEAGQRVRAGCRLMDEVNVFIRPGAILPGALNRLHVALSQGIATSSGDRISTYCKFAVASVAFETASHPNPFAKEWADAWFALETGGFELAPEDDDLKARARIDDGITRRTLPAVEVMRLISNAPVQLLGQKPGLLKRDLRQSHKNISRACEVLMSALRQIGHEGLVENSLRAFVTSLPGEVRQALIKDARSLSDGDIFSFDGEAVAAQTLEECRSLLIRAEQIQNRVARAKALACVGAAFNRLQAPQEFLKRIGVKAMSWEKNLPDEIRFNFWLERSSALRYIGRPTQALALARDIEPLAEALPLRAQRELRRHMAVLLRETGAPDRAVDLLEGLLNESPTSESLAVLESLAVTYQVVSRHADAADAFSRAAALSIADAVDYRYLVVAEALARANADQFGRALDLLGQLDGFQPGNERAVLTELAAWTVIASARPDVARQFPHRLKALVRATNLLANSARETRRHRQAATAYETLAYFCDAIGNATKASQAAALAQHEGEAHGAPPNPAMNLLIATEAFAHRRLVDARMALELVPPALGGRYSAVSDQEAALAGLGDLRRWFERTVRTAVQNGHSPTDVRVLMELRREAFRLARPPRKTGGRRRTLYQVLDDAALAQLAPAHERVLVLEWLDLGGRGKQPRLTVIGKGAVQDVRDINRPPLEPSAVGKDILNRLENWAGKDDPFEWAPWRALENWALDLLGQEVKSNDNFVLIEDHSSGHVPWHVILGSLAPVSYAQSWSMLLRSKAVAARKPGDKLGVLMVPRRNDNERIFGPFRSVCEELRVIASRLSMPFYSAQGATADRQAALDLIRGCNFVVLLCHGVYMSSESELALLVAQGGTLPPASLADCTERVGNPYRLSWRDIADAKRGAPIVVSTACSTGAGYFAGLGERLGLFREFHRIGSRSFIAPRWKIHAPDASEIVVDVARRHLMQGEGLGIALREASLAAIRKGMQRRNAWNLALEGGWR